MQKMCIALALMLMLGSWAAAEEVTYQPIHISLWGEPANGYEWICECEENGVLEEPLMEYVEGAQGSAGGNFDFYIGVRSPGVAQMTFSYGASWGIEPPERSVLCTAVVGEDGETSLRWAECFSDDKLLEVVLPSTPTSGWDWSYAGDSAGIVTLLEENYAPLYPDLEGAGGNTTYELRVDAPGETLLLFNYASVWDPLAAAQESYALRLEVGEDMEIALSIAENPDFDFPVIEE